MRRHSVGDRRRRRCDGDLVRTLICRWALPPIVGNVLIDASANQRRLRGQIYGAETQHASRTRNRMTRISTGAVSVADPDVRIVLAETPSRHSVNTRSGMGA